MKKSCTMLVSVFLCLLLFGAFLVPATAAEENWTSFRGNPDNIARTDTALPLPDAAVLSYRYSLKASDDWATNVSEPLFYDGHLVIAVGNELLLLDVKGNVANRFALSSLIGYNCRLAIADGKAIVPLSDASVQAVDLDTGNTVWHTQPVVTTDANGATQYHSMQSAIAFDGEYLYVPTVCFDSVTYAPVRGELLCINAQNGDICWTYDHTQGGYNWNGAVVTDGKVVIAGQDGVVSVFDRTNGAVLDRFALSAPVSSLVTYADGSYYTVSTDGVLHSFTVDDAGKVTETGSVPFAYSSTSSPAVFNGKAYVGGLLEVSVDWEHPAKGVFVVIDLAAMRVEKTVETPAEVKSSPLLGVADGVCAYFTCNNYPGALYCFDGNQVQEVYVPAGSDQNYCISSPIASADGIVYYWNDSGALLAIKKAESVMRGDLNGDGKITTLDARLLLRMSVDLDEKPENILLLGDMDENGKITTADARALLRQAVGLK